MLNYAGEAGKAGNGYTALWWRQLRWWQKLRNRGGGALTGVQVSIDEVLKVPSTYCATALQTTGLDITKAKANEA